MAGESTVLDVAFDNVVAANFQPYQVASLDTSANSNNITTAAQLPGAALAQPIGVVYDKARTDQTGAVIAGSGINVRVLGIARVIASGVVSVGAYVSVAGTNGQVQSQAKTGTSLPAGGLTNVVGIALTQAQAAGDRILVLLTPGVVI